jgi:methionyl-tRNA synthetase
MHTAQGKTVSETYYVTTPIYYVNDVPHIGHSYTTIAADVLARYFRAEGRDVHFLTGTDEHGVKILTAAKQRGMQPKELADRVVVHFQDLWKELEITNDDFIRTTEPRHEKRVQELIRRLLEKDEIYLGKYEGWYDEGQEGFVTESAARASGYKSPIDGRPLVRYGEPSYFFRLAKRVPALIEHIEADATFVLPEARRNEVLSKLRQGVEDLCISRPIEKLPWGVPMPNDASHVVYVWIDALSNYVTALGIPEIGDGDDGVRSGHWPADVHLIGKDILWFHAVYWPCMLMALDMPLPKCIFAHGWWTSEGKKMSKSLGNFISRETIAELCGEYSVDVYRYYLLRAVSFGVDGDFSREMLRQRYNSELANGVGNLLSRTVNMIGRYFDGRVPQQNGTTAAERPVLDAAADLAGAAPEAMRLCQFHVYLEHVMALAAETNRYIDATQPFRLAKDPSQRPRLQTILYTCGEALRLVLLHLAPFMPAAAERGLRQLGWQPTGEPLAALSGWGGLPANTRSGKSEPLFPRKD